MNRGLGIQDLRTETKNPITSNQDLESSNLGTSLGEKSISHSLRSNGDTITKWLRDSAKFYISSCEGTMVLKEELILNFFMIWWRYSNVTTWLRQIIYLEVWKYYDHQILAADITLREKFFWILFFKTCCGEITLFVSLIWHVFLFLVVNKRWSSNLNSKYPLKLSYQDILVWWSYESTTTTKFWQQI